MENLLDTEVHKQSIYVRTHYQKTSGVNTDDFQQKKKHV